MRRFQFGHCHLQLRQRAEGVEFDLGNEWLAQLVSSFPYRETDDQQRAIDAVKEGAALLRKTWGENLIGTVGLGLAFVAAYLVVLLAGGGLILLAINAGLQFMILVTALLAIVALVVLSALQATMQGVYSAALYRHATEPGRPLAGFTPEIMAVAFKPKG